MIAKAKNKLARELTMLRVLGSAGVVPARLVRSIVPSLAACAGSAVVPAGESAVGHRDHPRRAAGTGRLGRGWCHSIEPTATAAPLAHRRRSRPGDRRATPQEEGRHLTRAARRAVTRE